MVGAGSRAGQVGYVGGYSPDGDRLIVELTCGKKFLYLPEQLSFPRTPTPSAAAAVTFDDGAEYETYSTNGSSSSSNSTNGSSSSTSGSLDHSTKKRVIAIVDEQQQLFGSKEAPSADNSKALLMEFRTDDDYHFMQVCEFFYEAW